METWVAVVGPFLSKLIWEFFRQFAAHRHGDEVAPAADAVRDIEMNHARERAIDVAPVADAIRDAEENHDTSEHIGVGNDLYNANETVSIVNGECSGQALLLQEGKSG